MSAPVYNMDDGSFPQHASPYPPGQYPPQQPTQYLPQQPSIYPPPQMSYPPQQPAQYPPAQCTPQQPSPYPPGQYQQPVQASQPVPSYQNQAQQPNFVYRQPVKDANGNYIYSYDMGNISYQYITVDQWSQIPNDPSNYSQYWADQSAFEPKKFSENRSTEKKYYDVGWTVLFIINLLATIALLVILIIAKPKYSSTQGNTNTASVATLTTSSSSSIDTMSGLGQMLIDSLWISILVGLGISVIHFVYMALAPGVYIRFGFWLSCIVVCGICAIPLKFRMWYLLIFAGLYVLIIICVYCCVKRYIPMSVAVLAKTCNIIWKYPSVIFVCFVQAIINIIVCTIFAVIVYEIIYKGWSYYIYIYFFLSFIWINFCIYYLLYMTIVGAAATIYFLEGTDSMPSSPVWESFKRAATTSFGTCCYSSFVVAVIKTLRKVVNNARNSGGNSGWMAIICCVASCLLRILERIFRWVTKYALIYCAIYGIPFHEGCRRFVENDSKKFVSLLMGACIIGSSVGFHEFAFAVIGGAIGVLISYAIYGDVYLGMVLFGVFCLIFTIDFFNIWQSPVESISDALFVCYGECPTRMRTIASNLCDEFDTTYKLLLGEKTKVSTAQLESQKN